jgi:hypothetical protein
MRPNQADQPIRYITGDKKGNIWFGTFGGRRTEIRW